MKKYYKKSIKYILILFVVFLMPGIIGPRVALAATTPSLGMATTYGVLAGTYTNTVAGTTVNGDVGFTTGPAVAPLGIHTNYGSGAPYATAKTDASSALSALNSQVCTYTFPAPIADVSTDGPNGATGVYPPGVYCSTGAMNVGVGGITLNGAGTYIFRANGALTSTVGSSVTLSGASSCDVFWTPTAATTLAATTTFAGTIIDNANAITVGANTTWNGRAISLAAGTITTDTDTITVPVCAVATGTLHVVKAVINNNSGTTLPAGFNLHVKLSGVDVAGSPAAGTSTPGTSYTLAAGTYVVSEDVDAGYTSSFSGDCDASGNVTLSPGDDLTCTITNNDVAPAVLPATLNVVKMVVNDSGRNMVIADFPLFVNGSPVLSGVANTYPAPASYTVTETGSSQYGQAFSGDCDSNGVVNLVPGDTKICIITNDDTPISTGGGGGGSDTEPVVPPIISVLKVPSPLSLPSGPGSVTYTYTLRNIGTVPVTSLTMVDDKCSSVNFISGDTNNDDKLDLTESWIYRCSMTLSETSVNTVVATGWANGVSATDIAIATVVVSEPEVPPLIHVTKVPNPLTLPAGGGLVTYTEKITNPGTVPLTNVRLNDDKCAPMKFVSGDVNGDSRLDVTETWTYTCTSNLTKTTTNTTIAVGEANDFTVRDLAIATVVVGTVIPTLPNTGVAPAENVIIETIVLAIFVGIGLLFWLARRKQTR